MTVSQDDFKIEGYGEVVPPPSVSEVLDRIYKAAENKQPLTLAPSELRVLTTLL